MSFEPEYADDVERGDAFACSDCHEFVSYDQWWCPTCDEGRCEICGELVKKGQPFTRDPQFPTSFFCADPKCAEIADAPTVADLAARLANGGSS